MPHHDTQACCILELCCGGESRAVALADRIRTYTIIPSAKARAIADGLLADGFIKSAESCLTPRVLADIRATPGFEYHE